MSDDVVGMAVGTSIYAFSELKRFRLSRKWLRENANELKTQMGKMEMISLKELTD